ncbi:branched-chain amino acid ABC transporter substrate-binding protein [Nocardioides sp. CER19]|uniref:branched-chain amino acid ABC transporter substrate-binding protein n=1 Tax=Nocardioides sp. CER19 TaxID=3038538 RepID=UPI002447DCF6|nr:branched-chain amino acid ABC transporter substrate-binding protein [Nocardioides sp. CER19]MDH2416649.1 branched-chain amino acid ABC transporter substrate-binding protein [Nocardioides sp. CER19]
MRRNKWLGIGAVAISLGLAVSACGTTDNKSGGGSGSKGITANIGVMGALSGANASVVIPSVNGAELALSEWSAKHPDDHIKLVKFDSEGDPAKATPLATKMATDKSFLGLIGPAFSGETRATKSILGGAGLTTISQSATATDLTLEDPSPTFHRVIGYDEIQGAAIAKYIQSVLNAKKVFVVDDSSTYGQPLADKVKSVLGGAVTQSDKAQTGQTDFSAIVSKVKAAKPDAVFYAGYAAEAGPFLKQLRDGGVTAKFIGGDGLYGADFPKAAGSASDGAIVTCPCVPAEKVGGTFAQDYQKKFGEAPGAYAGEGYDAMTIYLKAFESGAKTREAVEKFVDSYEGQGLTKTYKFDEKGDVAAENVVVWSYKVQGGNLVPDQEISLG